MTTRPTLTRVQLEVLEAIARGEVSKPNHTGYDMGTWRVCVAGRPSRAVTVPTEAVIRKGLAELGHTADVRLYARLTDHGRELLADLASRTPDGKA